LIFHFIFRHGSLISIILAQSVLAIASRNFIVICFSDFLVIELMIGAGVIFSNFYCFLFFYYILL
jgi:hypothetical protein